MDWPECRVVQSIFPVRRNLLTKLAGGHSLLSPPVPDVSPRAGILQARVSESVGIKLQGTKRTPKIFVFMAVFLPYKMQKCILMRQINLFLSNFLPFSQKEFQGFFVSQSAV